MTREMIYKSHFDFEILETGLIKSFKYYMVSYGTHPCCYVCIPKGHKYYCKKVEELDNLLKVHGGITYYEKAPVNKFPEEKNCFIVGWDYGHCTDYNGLLDENIKLFRNVEQQEKHKWTTEELKEEVREVVERLCND